MTDLYFEAGDYPNAKEIIEKALTAGFTNPYFYTNHGIVLSKLGKIQDAIESLQKAVEIDPTNIYAQSWLDKLEKSKFTKP